MLLELRVTESALETGGFLRPPVSGSEGIQPGSPDLPCSPAPFKTLCASTGTHRDSVTAEILL